MNERRHARISARRRCIVNAYLRYWSGYLKSVCIVTQVKFPPILLSCGRLGQIHVVWLGRRFFVQVLFAQEQTSARRH